MIAHCYVTAWFGALIFLNWARCLFIVDFEKERLGGLSLFVLLFLAVFRLHLRFLSPLLCTNCQAIQRSLFATSCHHFPSEVHSPDLELFFLLC